MDYLKMKKINRNALYEFLSSIRKRADADETLKTHPFRRVNDIIPVNFLDKSGELDDFLLDRVFCELLKCYDFGAFLTDKIMKHFEYFMNTLRHDHKQKTENPFLKPDEYKAFGYKTAESEERDDLIDEDDIQTGGHELNNLTPVGKETGAAFSMLGSGVK